MDSVVRLKLSSESINITLFKGCIENYTEGNLVCFNCKSYIILIFYFSSHRIFYSRFSI